MVRRIRVFAQAAAVLMLVTIASGPMFAPAAAAAVDTQPPTVPGTPVAVNVTPVQLTLAWAPSTDDVAVTGYDIFRSAGSPVSFASVGTSATNSFVDTGLSPGTIYLYQIRARDAAGNVSAFSPIVPAMTPGPCTTPPPAPGNLTILAVGPTSVSLRWGIVVPSLGCSPAGFDVLRATGDSGGTFTPIAQTGFTDTYVDTTVAPNTTYRYQVRSRSANGLVSGPSNTVRVTTPDGCTPPLPLGSLTVTATTPNSVSLAWAGPTNPACFAYDILRAPGSTGTSYTVVGTTTGLSFTNVGLAPSTAYRFMVRARIVPTAAVWATTLPVAATTLQGCSLIPPPAPGNLTAVAVTSTSATLTWAVTAAPGCSFSYQILRAPGASGGTFVQVGTATGNTFTDTGLTPNTTYRYQARTRDAAGNESPISNTVTVTTTAGTGACAASYRIVNAWPGAFQGEVAVTNTGTGAINGWQVTLTLSGGATVTQLWGGRTGQTASPYTITNETYNGNLAAGGSTTVGFNANVAGATGAAGTVNCTVS